MIRVVLVDNQNLIRQGVRSLLELAGDMVVVAEASDGEEGLAVIRRQRPDVVLLDLRMPKKDGVEVLKALQLARTRLVRLHHFIPSMTCGAAGGGAGRREGLSPEGCVARHLTAAIRDVVAGGTVIRPVVTERVLRGLEHVHRDSTP